MKPTPSPASVAPSKRAAALPRSSSLPAVASGDVAEDRRHAGGGRRALEEPGPAEDGQVRGQAGEDHRDRPEDRPEEHHPVMAEPVGQDAEERRQAPARPGRTMACEQGRRSTPSTSLAAVLGQLGQVEPEHRAGQAGAEAEREGAGQDGAQRAFHRGILAARGVRGRPSAAGPAPYHARNVPVARRRAPLEPRRDLHRFRVRPGPGPGRGRRDRDRARCWSASAKDSFKAGRRALDGRLLGPDDSPRTRRSRRPPRRRRASSRRPTRRRSPTAPTRSSRSTWRAPCRARSRAPRSPATCCPTARSTSSTRWARRWPRGSWPRWPSSWRPRAARRPRSPRSSRRARRTCAIYVALETLEYLKKGGRISGAQAAIGTLLSVKPIIAVKDGVVETRRPGPDAVEGARAADRAGRRAADRAARRSSTR